MKATSLCACWIGAAAGLGCSVGAVDREPGSDAARRTLQIVERHAAFRDATARAIALASGDDALVGQAADLAVRLPRHATGATRLARVGRADLWLDVAPESLRDVPGADANGVLVYAAAGDALDVVTTLSPGKLEELRVAYSDRAPAVARYRITHGPSISKVDVSDGVVRARDATGAAVFSTEPAFAEDALGRRRSLDVSARIDGDATEISFALDRTGLTYPIVVDPAWTTVAPMHAARDSHTATLLSGSRVFVAGGGLAAERYDATANTWQSVATSPIWRLGGAAFLLPAGNVLLSGGNDYLSGALAAPTLYDPIADAWSPTGPQTTGHARGAYVQAADGRPMMLGGFDHLGTPLAAISSLVERYDPVAGTWSLVASMHVARVDFGVASLKGGRLLVAGGMLPGGTTWTSSAELYDPSSDAWTVVANTLGVPSVPTLFALADGRALLVDAAQPALAEVYDPVADAWTAMSSPNHSHGSGAVAALGSGRVAWIGGSENGSSHAYVDVFDPVADAWGAIMPLSTARESHTATTLPSGAVVVAGGQLIDSLAGIDQVLSSVELLTELPLGQPCGHPLECASGRCIDGVCCNTTCTGPCQACDVASSLGTCSPVPSGAPHGGRSCSPYATCSAGSCASGCATSADCAATSYCLGGLCFPRVAAGGACAASRDCTSSYCADGVCCDRACNGQCEACDGAISRGICHTVTGAPHGARAPCGGAAPGTTCGSQCTGGDPNACGYASTAVSCSLDGCVAGVETHARQCDGAGSCTDAPTSCGAYVCGTTACKSACAADADCASGHRCSAGACVAWLALGQVCSSAAECSSGACVDGVCCSTGPCGVGASCAAAGHEGSCIKLDGATCAGGGECLSSYCVDGVCCESKCDGQCAACNDASQLGRCVAVQGAPRGTRAACADGAGDPCKAAYCDGHEVNACAGLPGATTACRAASCDASGFVAAASCNGMGACAALAPAPCDPYVCAGVKCGTSCSAVGDCATGYQCSAGKCIVPSQPTCSKDLTESIGADGNVRKCGKYACVESTGVCAPNCLSDVDCAPDYRCTLADHACVIPAPAEAASSGACSVGATSSKRSRDDSWAAVTAALALALLRRRCARGQTRTKRGALPR